MDFFGVLPPELLEIILLAFWTRATARDIARLLQVSRTFNSEIRRIIEASETTMSKWQTTYNHKFAIKPIAGNPKLHAPRLSLPWLLDIDPNNYLFVYHLNRVLDDPHRKFIVPISEMKTATYEKTPPCSRLTNDGDRRYFSGSYILYDESIWDIMANKTCVFPWDVELWCYNIWDFRDCGGGFATFAIRRITSYSVFIVDMNGDANYVQHEISMSWSNMSLIAASCFAVSCDEFVAAFVNKNTECVVVYKKGISERRINIDWLPKRLTKFQVGITGCAFYVVADDSLYVCPSGQTNGDCDGFRQFEIHVHDPSHHRAILKDGTIIDLNDPLCCMEGRIGVVFRQFEHYDGCLGFTSCLIGTKYAVVVWDDQVLLINIITGLTIEITDRNSFAEVAFQVMRRYDDILVNNGNTLMVLRGLGDAACF